MANLDTTYNPDDRTQAFEKHSGGYLISLAGPGTGKTYSLLKRTEALTAQGVAQDTICYLTFIKEISKAFIQDYIEKFGQESYDTHKPRISTLHSLACRLLRHQGFQIGFDGVLYFANTEESDSDAAETILSDLLPYVNAQNCRTVSQLRKHIHSIKCAWRDIVDPLTLPSPVPAIVPVVQNLFKAFRLIDWDQTIPLSHTLATTLEPLPDWITDIKHYFVDEYQDFNKAEQALISFLSTHATSTVIVGDDDQSLYSGRGGSPDGLRTLYANPTHDQVSLVKCFRCRETIVNAANTFQRTMHPVPRLMLPTKDDGQIIAYRFKSSKAELAYLSAYLQDCIVNLPASPAPKDGTVCLFPSWKVLDSYFERLSPIIPCIKKKGNLSPDRIWLERVLHLLIEPDQRFVQRLILNSYLQIKPRHKRPIVQRIVQRDISTVSSVQSLISDGSLVGLAATQAQEFCNLIDHLSTKDPEAIAPHISEKLGIDVHDVSGHLSTFLMKADTMEQDELLEEYCDLLLPDTKTPTDDPRSILFLTMHGSKGLTKRNVVIPGMEAAWLPGTAAGTDLEERRRLFYVALTRATDRVLITLPWARAPKDPLNFPTPGRGIKSPFIADAGLPAIYHS